MAQISSYPSLTPQLGDKLLGSNSIDASGVPVSGNPTAQYTLTSVKTLVDQNYVLQLESSNAVLSQSPGVKNTTYSIQFGTPETLDTAKNVQLLQGGGSVTAGDKIQFNSLGTYQITLNYSVGTTGGAVQPLLVFRTLQDGTTQVGPTVVVNKNFDAIYKPIPLVIPITVQITTIGTYYEFQMAISGTPDDGGLVNNAAGINAAITPTFTAAANASIKISKLI
tara:strand:+ start:77 stop:745 length:669 start_codon:yes stop_codon:yes gene_type:complete